ncbi:MAG TPA: mannitol dehydrogenase, partial [Clostridia bacterium]|nr:mannitol dehydrogenase [Clostridia bacterium]
MKFVQYGAGNIGRGFIGQIFSKAGYEVVFVDVNMEVVDKLNQDRRYPVKIVSAENIREEIIENVRAVDGRDADRVAQEIADADMMATAVGVNILPRIVPVIAEGLRRRHEAGRGGLDIIICENMIDADKMMRKLLIEALPEELAGKINRLVGLVEASIGRMVPVMTTEMQQGNILRVVVEEYDLLPVDKDAFINPIPPVPNLRPFSPFEFYIRRKLFIHNLGHAVCAYLGYLKGYSLLCKAVNEESVRGIAYRAMQESAQALSIKYSVDKAELDEHIDDLLYRFANPHLGDTTERVGKDTIRKLSPNDRLVGAAMLCRETGVHCTYIPVGIAAALLFAPPEDTASCEVKEMAQKDITAALKKY